VTELGPGHGDDPITVAPYRSGATTLLG
jgi:hypothetical protein